MFLFSPFISISTLSASSDKPCRVPVYVFFLSSPSRGFLRVIFTVFRQDSIQDVLAESNIRVFKELYLVLNNAKKTVSDWKNLNYDISNSYDKELMYKLSLANYQIFRSCTSFNPKIFYDYILDIAKFLDKNYSEISENILYLASTVLKESLDRLNLSEVNYD